MHHESLFVGTSGFSYREWRGSFYPDDMKEAGMLGYYAAHFRTVELNNTFYRLPNEGVLQQWAAQVPAAFRFALKASRTITHIKRLRDVAAPVEYLCRVTATLGAARGPILFGLPPNMKQDADRLSTLLALLPPDVQAAVEFRHPSWYDEKIFELLRSRNVALCVAETDDEAATRVATADWGYVRLRRTAYEAPELAGWLEWLNAQQWRETFVYFKHEDAGTGPRLARELLALAAAAPPA